MQTDSADRPTAALIDDLPTVSVLADEQAAENESDKQAVKTDDPLCLTIDFDHANASFAVNAIVSDEHMQKLPTLQEIQELPTSADFGDLHFYLRDGTLPDDDKKARKILLQAQDYTLESDALWHLYTPRTRNLDRAYSVVKRLCVPEKFRDKIACVQHNNNCHVGADRVFAASRFEYFYPGQYTHLRKHVLSCETCQKAKEMTHPQKAPIGDLGLTVLGQKWFLDTHGPFPQTAAGNSYICVFIEHVSLWTEFYPMAQLTAEAIVHAFLDCVISRFGAAKQLCLVSDRGSAFTSQLMATFSKVFHITQIFSAPYKHNQNQPAEIIDATINKSLRILCADNKEWDKVLPMVALSYRSTPTAGKNLSPSQIWFARQMFVETDFSLLSDENIADIAPSHLNEVRLRLKVLQTLAIQNATQNAERHRLKYNQKAKIPTYKVGDKVLLEISNVKPHQCAKLQFKFRGPFLILQLLNGYQYRLKDLTTSKIMKYPVHADKLRPFNKLEGTTQQLDTSEDVCLYSEQTPKRHIDVQVKIEDVTTVSCDAIVRLLTRDLDEVRGASRAILKLAGNEYRQQCEQYIRQLGQPSPSCTAAGPLLLHARHIVHALLPELNDSYDHINTEAELISAILQCLLTVDTMSDISTIVIAPIATQSVGMDQWTLSHAMVKALCKFDEQTCDNPGQVKVVQFVNLCITNADVLCVVLRQLMLQEQQEVVLAPPEATSQVPQSTENNQSQRASGSQVSTWVPIKDILGHRRRKGKDYFLVAWDGSSQQDWIEKRFITEAALKHYYANKKPRKKRRRHY
jgi:O-acetyl-ADP-ribose deacetylase (regulator of RNase III)